MTDIVLRTNYALLLFYVREKYWHHAEEVCISAIQTYDDHLFRVWRAMTLDQQGLVNEALREYKAVESRRMVAIPAWMGMLIIYKRNRDQEGITIAETKLDGYNVADNISGWVQAAALCWAAGDINSARDTLLKFTEAEAAAAAHRDEYTNYLTIRGWVDLLSGRGMLLEKAGSYFAKALELEKQQNIGYQPESYLSTDGAGARGDFGRRELQWLDLNAALGRAAYLERKMQIAPAQEILNALVVLYPNCVIPPLVVKARLLMNAEDWSQAVDTTQRILAKEKNNVEALTLEALYAVAKDTRYDAAAVRLRRLSDAVKAKEPRNGALFHQFSQVFSGLAGDRLDLLNITTQFSEVACSLDSRSGDFLCSMGYQQLYKGDLKTALATFRKAANFTDSLSPLLGTVTCHLRQGELEEAKKQLDLCNELQPSNQRNAELCLLNAQVMWKQKKSESKVVVLLDQAAEAIRSETTTYAGSGMEVYIHINCPVSLAIVREYLLHCRSEPPDPTFQQVDVVAEKCARHLEFLVRHLPACMEAQLMLAKVHFISGDFRKAQSLLKDTLLVQEQPLAEALLLSSQICQYMGDTKLASRALEQALTLDFGLQDQPLYNLLLGTVQGTMGKSAASLETLKKAMTVVKSAAVLTSAGKPVQILSVPEHVTLYLQLAQAYLRVHDVDAARETLTEAANSFRSTSQGGRIAIAQAMLAARTDVDKSIELLRQVPTSSEYYVTARSQLGKLFLTQKHSMPMYIQCFEEMAEAAPTAQSYVELGEAYSTIQEPEQAIAAYEKARALAPSSKELSVRVGRALVASHNYAKAVRYYQDAITADPHLSAVRADLATLLWRLGDLEMAQDTITSAPVLQVAPSVEEPVSLAIERINLHLLLYKVLRDAPQRSTVAALSAASASAAKGAKTPSGAAGDGEGGGSKGGEVATVETTDIALQALLNARKHQQYLIDFQLRSETREVLTEQRSIMASICTELGARYASYSTNGGVKSSGSTLVAGGGIGQVNTILLTQAKEQLQDAIKFDEASERALLEAAQLCARVGDVDGCEERCNMILNMNPSCEQAVVLLATQYSRRGRTDDATTMFQELLERTPHNYDAMVEFLLLLYRAGQLSEAESILENAEQAVPAGQRADPGLSYARGLYAHFSNNNAEALRLFNHARLPADNPWCTRALTRMIRIYLVPTTQDLWISTATAASPKDAPANGRERNASVDMQDNLRYAEQLLLLLPVHSEARQVLHGFCTVATRRPAEIETAMHLFLDCIELAEKGELGHPPRGSPPPTKGSQGADGAQKSGGAAEEMDEDDLLLANMHEAASGLARRGQGQGTATLAFALQCEQIHPEAFLGLAISLYLQSQATAARNVLARLLEAGGVSTGKAPPPAAERTGIPAAASTTTPTAVTHNGGGGGGHLTTTESDTMERALLLLAHIDAESGDLTTAQATLQYLLEVNKSCGAAWDALGMLYERQHKHRDASGCYERAWELVKEADPAVGYKLGFNYLRGNDPVRAIDVCQRVLAHHATYPRIESDVMDVAYSMLRP